MTLTALPKPPTVLIVEDESHLLDILASDIAELGCDVIQAQDGAVGLELARKGGIDTILTDINMPQMDGLEMLRVLRAENIETPIVFLTGWSTRERLAEALRLGCFDFLHKPAEPLLLRKTIRMALAYGVLLRNLESELDTFMAPLAIRPADVTELRAKKRQISIAKIQRLAQQKKEA